MKEESFYLMSLKSFESKAPSDSNLTVSSKFTVPVRLVVAKTLKAVVLRIPIEAHFIYVCQEITCDLSW